MSSALLEKIPPFILFSNFNVFTRAALFGLVYFKKENLEIYFIHKTEQTVEGF
jgi:hypothetical protein